MGTLTGIAAGAVALAGLDLLLGAGSGQVAGLAATPANWLQKLVDPNTPGVPWLTAPQGQVGHAGQLLQQILPNLVPGMTGSSSSAAVIPAPNTIPPPTQPATLNA
jgi:hypothetical protein